MYQKTLMIIILLISMTITSCSNSELNSNTDVKENTLEKLEGKEKSDKESSKNVKGKFDEDKVWNSDLTLETKFFLNNRKKLISKMKNNSILVLFTDPVSEGSYYTPNRNFYYLTGIDRENFILLLTKINGKVDEYIFGNEGGGITRWTGYVMGLRDAKDKSGINNGYSLNLFYSYLDKIIKDNNIKNIYLDVSSGNIDMLSQDNTSILKYQSPGDLFALDILDEDVNILEVRGLISSIREVKSDKEIDNIKRAIDVTGEGIKSMMKNLKLSMIEYQLQSYFDFTTKTLGSREYSFLPIIASGLNATVLHYQENDSVMKSGELLLIDVGASYGHYSADISRTFPVSGKFTDRQRDIYNGVLRAQEKIIKAIKPGVTMFQLNEFSKEVLAKEAVELGLINNKEEIRDIYMHGIGHSLGLDTHDPMESNTLKPGMIITIEPGLYIDDEKIGIRIEDDILITEDGYVNLSENIIKTVEEIEEFMAK